MDSNGLGKCGELKLNEKEASLLLQFKDNVGELLKTDSPHHTDHKLVKWLIARKWDLKKAEAMFRQATAYRETMRLDHILEEFIPPEVTKYLTGGIGCFDKTGSPVRIERFGYLDIKGMVYSIKKSDLEKYKMYEQEKALRIMIEQSEKLGKTVDKLTVLMDLEKISMKQLWRPGLQLYMHMVQALEDNYPEFVKSLIVVNAPKIFPMFYKLCRPLISEDMRKKLKVYGADYQEQLLNVIDSEELPAFLGGKQTGPGGDIYCKQKIKPGGAIPEKYYLKDLIDTAAMESASIGAGSKLLIKLPINQPNCIIRWEFMTQGKDIAFGINLRQNNKEKLTSILPITRVSSHMVPEDGTLACDKLGTYIIVFDNSYSWTKGKKLSYTVEALVEDDEIMDEVQDIVDGDYREQLEEP